jgi:hypothetical protein
MMRKILLALLACLAFAVPAKAAGSYSDWAAIIVAGDDHAHDGSPSKVFDNGRHDIGVALQRIGFNPNNIAEFSVDSEKYTAPAPQPSEPQIIFNALWDLSNRTTGGCLVYFTSHGSPDGVLVGDDILSPHDMADMIGNACGSRPVVAIVSSCFSGVFVPALKGQNNLVLTAARPDRTSFGCGQSDRYTFFDQCFLQTIGGAHDFPALGAAVQSCVAARELKDGVAPPSQPQLFVGRNVAATLPKW